MKARIGAGLMIWLAAVMSVAGIAWLAIGTAGKQVTADPIAAPLPTEFPPSASPTRTVSPTRTTFIGDDVSPTPAKVVRAPARGSDPASATTTTTAARPDRSDPPRDRVIPVTSTYSTAAGRLRVRCEGQSITLDGGYAQPAPGWAVHVLSGGPDAVRVTFGAGKTPPITVVAECGNGRPRFREAMMPASAPATEGGGWHFTNQRRATPPTTPATTPATTPCAPAPTATATSTPTATATSTPTATPTPPTECPPVETKAPVTEPSTPPARAWTDVWSEREWSQRNRQPQPQTPAPQR